LLVLLLVLQTTAACADVADCRAQAQAAAARGDYEIFHDLAWRAVQKGPRNDTSLMDLLARAMALSGRYGDALVMLGRIADLGGQTDALTSPDFALVRRLKEWPALEAKLSGRPAPEPSAAAASPPAAASTTPSPAVPAATGTRGFENGDVLSFEGASLDPIALAHDAVSRRFLMGDRRARRLVIIDEVSHHVVNYVSASSSSFLQNLTGFAIDARRGDLWVVSTGGDDTASSSMLHKLQLVSGRTLAEIAPPDEAGAVRFVGVCATPDGTVYALDGAGSRLYRVRPGTRALELVMRLESRAPSALVAVDDRVLYVATGEGLARVDPSARTLTRVKSAEELNGLESLAWRGGSLIAVQPAGDSYAVVRLSLDGAGTRVQRRTVLASSSTPTVGTLGRDGYYYLSDAGTIRRLSLR
jgi:streptogramin lyase